MAVVVAAGHVLVLAVAFLDVFQVVDAGLVVLVAVVVVPVVDNVVLIFVTAFVVVVAVGVVDDFF